MAWKYLGLPLTRWAFLGDMPLLIAVVTDYQVAIPCSSSSASISGDGLLLHQGHEVLDILAETGKATCLVAICAAWHRLRWCQCLGLRLVSQSSNLVIGPCMVIFIIINIESVIILAVGHSGCLLPISRSSIWSVFRSPGNPLGPGLPHQYLLGPWYIPPGNLPSHPAVHPRTSSRDPLCESSCPFHHGPCHTVALVRLHILQHSRPSFGHGD